MSETYTAYDYAKLFATVTNQNVFLTGKAGTGKTTFLHHLKESSQKQMAVVAPTGVAAINAGGVTIHSFFQLPLSPFLPTEWGRKELIGKQRMISNKRNVLRELELLVIDEISMVRADVLDAIDTVLRHVRYRPTEPFGGVQMIFIGDMYQLSPVVQPEEWQILSGYYSDVYFFNSHVFQEKPFVHIEFKKIFRQSDTKFIHLLNEVRENRLSPSGRDLLNACYKPDFDPHEDDTYVTLTTHNFKADRINREELEKIGTPSNFFQAEIKGEFSDKSYPAEENLELKIGAKVMFIRNDTETPRRFFNGKIGVVVGWRDNAIQVKCTGNAEPIEVSKIEWENIRYQTDATTLQVEEEKIGSFIQYPLRLAWAITIHKSQGLTFDKAIVDAGLAFAPGQVYVALSRCRSLDGLVLQSKIHDVAIQNDKAVVDFSARQLSAEQLEKSYLDSRNAYFLSLLVSIFNFKPIVGAASRWLNAINDVATSFNDETIDFLRNVNMQVNELQSVGQKFGVQITEIVTTEPFNEELLNLRLEASVIYFSEKLDVLIETLVSSPAVTDSRENGRMFDDYLMDIYTFVHRKLHWIKGCADGFGIEKYFDLRKKFVLPKLKTSAYALNRKRKAVKSKHPELLGILYELRNAIVAETGLPIYLVANSKTLEEMANYLPQNKADMLKISGIGEAKYRRFGTQFLEVIREYCETYNIASDMDELFDTEKAQKKTKKRKGASALETLEAYQKGLSIEEIAQMRHLSETTIAGHLAEFTQKGELDIEQFVDKKTLRKAQELVANNQYDGSVWNFLKEHFTPNELIFIMAWLRNEANH